MSGKTTLWGSELFGSRNTDAASQNRDPRKSASRDDVLLIRYGKDLLHNAVVQGSGRFRVLDVPSLIQQPDFDMDEIRETLRSLTERGILELVEREPRTGNHLYAITSLGRGAI